jgi:hypothetical protein
MFDRELPEAPFCLRIATQDGCEHVELEDAQGPAMSLPAAVCVCTRDGYEPTHYCEPGRGVHRIPDAIVRRPASPAQKPSA